jgi:hypothetical protein
LNLPELDIPEPKPTIPVVDRLDPYCMPDEGFANHQELTAEGDHAIRRRGPPNHPSVRVLPSWDDKGVSWSGAVNLGWRFSSQRFVRPNLIELLSPAVHRPLLGPMISLREGFHVSAHVSMHSLVTAVVLRAPRP